MAFMDRLVFILFPCASVIGMYVFVKIALYITKGYYKVINNLNGKTVIITGANTGIGKETAIELAAQGAKVILACRNTKKAEAAQNEIIAKTGNINVIVKQLDLCCFESVRNFASDILKTETRLDILINNAGMNTPPVYKKTDDGYDETLQANHLGHFLLTLLLLDLLRGSAPSRIVNVASLASWFGIGDVDTLNFQPTWWSISSYGKTKGFNILFTIELAKQLSGTGVTVNSCHPGFVVTELLRPRGDKNYWFLVFLRDHFGKTCKDGALTTLYVATSDQVKDVSGEFYCDCRKAPLLVPPWAKSDCRAQRLWESSLKAVKFTDTRNLEISTQQQFCFFCMKRHAFTTKYCPS